MCSGSRRREQNAGVLSIIMDCISERGKSVPGDRRSRRTRGLRAPKWKPGIAGEPMGGWLCQHQGEMSQLGYLFCELCDPVLRGSCRFSRQPLTLTCVWRYHHVYMIVWLLESSRVAQVNTINTPSHNALALSPPDRPSSKHPGVLHCLTHPLSQPVLST